MTGPQNLADLNPIEILRTILKHEIYRNERQILGLRKPCKSSYNMLPKVIPTSKSLKQTTSMNCHRRKGGKSKLIFAIFYDF